MIKWFLSLIEEKYMISTNIFSTGDMLALLRAIQSNNYNIMRTVLRTFREKHKMFNGLIAGSAYELKTLACKEIFKIEVSRFDELSKHIHDDLTLLRAINLCKTDDRLNPKENLINEFISTFASDTYLDKLPSVLQRWNIWIEPISVSVFTSKQRVLYRVAKILNTSIDEIQSFGNNKQGLINWLYFTTNGRTFEKEVTINGETRLIKFTSAIDCNAISDEVHLDTPYGEMNIVLFRQFNNWIDTDTHDSYNARWLKPHKDTQILNITYRGKKISTANTQLTVVGNSVFLESKYRNAYKYFDDKICTVKTIFTWNDKYKDWELLGDDKDEIYMLDSIHQPEFAKDEMCYFNGNVYTVRKQYNIEGLRFAYIEPCKHRDIRHKVLPPLTLESIKLTKLELN